MGELIPFPGGPNAGVKPDASIVNDCLARLHTAFPRSVKAQNPQAMLEVYRNGLTGFDGQALSAAVDKVIRDDQHFPRVARLREIAHEWTRRNRVHIDPLQRRDALSCPQCGEAYTWRRRWRPKCGGDGTHGGLPTDLLLTADQQAVLLEPYERCVCACAAACEYAPDETDDPDAPAQMSVGALPEHTKLRVKAQLLPAPNRWRRAAGVER